MSIKLKLLDAFRDHPLRSRLVMMMLGALAALALEPTGIASSEATGSANLATMAVFSVVVYAFMFTLYRMLQLLFKRKAAQGHDERLLVQSLGLYGVMSFGAVWILLANMQNQPDGFGQIMLIEGLSIALAAKVSVWIKR